MIDAAIVNDTRADAHFGCSAVMNSIERLCAENGIRPVARVPLNVDWRDPPWREKLSRVQLIIVNGEGTIHHDAAAGKTLVAVAQFARENGIRSALINTSWHENSPTLAMKAKAFDFLAVRESLSKSNLAQSGVVSEVMPDLSILGIDPRPTGRKNISFIGSVLPQQSWDVARLRRRIGGHPISILAARSSIVEECRVMLSNSGLRRSGARWLDALATIADLRSGKMQNPSEFEEALSNSTLLVTGRFHAAVMALALNIPVLALESNTPKISATFADAGLRPWRIVDADNVNDEMIAKASYWHSGEKDALLRWLSNGKKRQRSLFSRMSARCAPLRRELQS